MLQPAINAKWKKLLLVNYTVDQNLLLPHVPFHTELALWNGNCYLSLVGFLFLDVNVAGLAIPLHQNFVEINLRFYVRRRYENEWRYGVVFLKEIVALPLVSFVANTFFNEHYETLPVGYKITSSDDNLYVEYNWKKEKLNRFHINCNHVIKEIETGSQEDFLTAQHWGYTKLGPDRTSEYSVLHSKWELFKTLNYDLSIDYSTLGSQFAFLNEQLPASVFLAEGSDIVLKPKTTIVAEKN